MPEESVYSLHFGIVPRRGPVEVAGQTSPASEHAFYVGSSPVDGAPLFGRISGTFETWGEDGYAAEDGSLHVVVNIPANLPITAELVESIRHQIHLVRGSGRLLDFAVIAETIGWDSVGIAHTACGSTLLTWSVDTVTSASRQNYIETGRYLEIGRAQ